MPDAKARRAVSRSTTKLHTVPSESGRATQPTKSRSSRLASGMRWRAWDPSTTRRPGFRSSPR